MRTVIKNHPAGAAIEAYQMVEDRNDGQPVAFSDAVGAWEQLHKIVWPMSFDFPIPVEDICACIRSWRTLLNVNTAMAET
jgi:hypothetical protein